MNMLKVMSWLLISSVFFTWGEYLSKKFATTPSFIYIMWIVVAYVLSTLAWLPAIMARNQLSVVGAIWSVISLATTVAIGTVLFGEKLNVFSIAGLGAAVVSIVLLSFS